MTNRKETAMNNSDSSKGTVTVSMRAAAQTVEYITKTQNGVADISSKRSIQHSFLSGHGSRSVHFTNTDSGLVIEISIYTVYGANVNKICSSISDKIKNELENNMGIPVSKVKVFVEGVRN